MKSKKRKTSKNLISSSTSPLVPSQTRVASSIIGTPKSQFNDFVERQKKVGRKLSVNYQRASTNIKSNYKLRKSAIKGEWTTWATNSNIHGVPQLTSGNFSRFCTWILIVSMATSVLSWYLWQRVDEYTKYQTSTNINSVATNTSSLPFPAITICNYNG